MPELPLVTIGVITFNRFDEIKRTVAALAQHLTYPADRLRWIVADDSSPGDYVAKLNRLKLFRELGVTVITTGTNSGWGRNANHLLDALETDYLLMAEDDYVLTEPLDLRAGVALLEAKPHIGYLHYYGTAGEHVVLHQFEAQIGDLLPDFRDGMSLPGTLTYLQLDGYSPSPYLYSNRPHLVHRRFHDYYGRYDEGRKLGATEEAFAIRVKSAMQADPDGAPGIAVLPGNIVPVFDHIGTSWQHTEADHAR